MIIQPFSYIYMYRCVLTLSEAIIDEGSVDDTNIHYY